MCVPAEEAFAALGRTTYVVDQNNPSASDQGPGSAAQPWRTISRAAQSGALRPGDAVLIRAGMYREQVSPQSGGTGPGSRITYAAYPGDQVVVTGADPSGRWTRHADGTWRLPWTGPGLETYSSDRAFRRELVVRDGRPLRAATSRASIEDDRYWVDGPSSAPQAVHARFEGEPTNVEVGARERLFWPLGPDRYAECGDSSMPGWLRVVGFTFRHASNRAQWGAFCAGSEGSLIEDVRVEWTIGLGIDISGRDHTFRRVRADLNGQMGWGGSCSGCVLEDGAAVANNWVGHDPFWEAGGMKLVGTTDTVVKRHYAAHNGGPGIWLDGGNRRNTIERSLAVGNEMAGIMLELETTETLVQHNVVARTRWLEWTGTGILSQAASRNAYVHNTIVESEGSGLWLRLDPDRRAEDGSNIVWGNLFSNNVTSRNEAREMSVTGTSIEHVRSNRFEGNHYPLKPASTDQSTFYLYPAPGTQAGFRGSDIETWRRLTLGDRRATIGDVLSAPDEVDPCTPGFHVGAPSTDVIPYDQAGADPTLVRATAAWQSAPPAPAWPR
ncbi:right-handed parallel beta-helix repeat-containing protein [Rubrivirga sp.]|uniref:right-handed parallel beta-helix repeat-containing protein n=1 Tax=Rubrivirga sp. TaxID=1885344 RepID=UPI003C7741FE